MDGRHTKICSMPLVHREKPIKTTMRYYYIPSTIATMEKLAVPSFGENVKTLELLVEMQNGRAVLENTSAVS